MTDLRLHRGESKIWRGSLTLNGALIPFVPGDAFYFAARKTYPASSVTSDASASIAKSTETSGIVLTDATYLVFELRLSKADTRSLDPGRYYWEIKYTPAGNEAQVIGGGILIVEPDVVRAV